MGTIEYSLFRIKMIKPKQRSFLHEDLLASEFLLRAIAERPAWEVREGFVWHLGNLHMLSELAGYFAIGRTTTSTIEKFDERTGNFVEEELEASPYTHCVFDASVGFVGIARKATLAPTARSVASRLEKVLSSAPVVTNNGLTVEVRPIPDPDGFLKAISTAFRVFRFTATFRGPNPFDADEHFQKPLSVYLASAGGTKGSATVSGEDLDREVISAVTRSTAATGNEAKARIQRTNRQRPVTVNLKGDPVKRRYDEEEHRPEVVLADLQEQYRRVRWNEAD